MSKARNLRILLAAFALVLGLSVMPGLAHQMSASRSNQMSTQAQQPMMSMSQMMQRMHELMGETSQMMHQMPGMQGQQGMGMGHMHGMMMGGNGMMSMPSDLNQMANNMNQLMSDLNMMMSNQDLMKNKTFKEQAQQMQSHMATMMENFGSMVGTVKQSEQQEKK